MKKASDIISHLLDSPCFSEISLRKNIQAFVYCLPFSLRRGIAFFYVKENVLFFALNHPAFLQEFNYKMPTIKSALKQYQQLKNALLEVADIKAFVAKTPPLKLDLNPSESFYGELAYGDFENLAKDKEIFEKFEKIREIILCHNQK